MSFFDISILRGLSDPCLLVGGQIQRGNRLYGIYISTVASYGSYHARYLRTIGRD